MKTRFEVVAKAGGALAEIFIYGPVGEDIFSEGITAARFQKALSGLPKGVRSIDLHIDSEGGSVMDARAIYTQLVQHQAAVHVKIDGLAASAASFIAMSGDTIAIAEGGFFMIHEARGVVRGTADDMETTARLLRQVNDTITSTYAARTGATTAQLKSWMKAETWFTGTDAVKHGFADSLLENKRIAAHIERPEMFKNLPPELTANRRKLNATIERINSYGR